MTPSHIIVTISNTYHVTCDPADTPITALCDKYSVRVTRGKMVTGDLLMGAKPISVLEVCQTASSRSFHTLYVSWLSHLFEFSFSQLRASFDQQTNGGQVGQSSEFTHTIYSLLGIFLKPKWELLITPKQYMDKQYHYQTAVGFTPPSSGAHQN